MRTVPGWVARWRGDWSCCFREVPQSAPEVLFLFGKILLLNTVAPSVQGRSCPLTQPTSPARPGTVHVRAQFGPTLNLPQPATTVSLCLPHFILFPSLRPQAPRYLSVLFKLCSAGEGAVTSSLPRVLQQARWVWALGCSPLVPMLVPGTYLS